MSDAAPQSADPGATELPPSDPPSRALALSRGTMTYTEEGSGPALVAIHGLPGSARDFRWLGAALEGRVRLIRLELPGWGGSDTRLVRRHDADQWADVVVEALDALALEAPTLAGHSAGGVVAMRVAARAPRRLGQLAILAAPGLAPHRLLRRSNVKLGALITAIPGLRQLSLPALRRSYAKAGFPTSLTDAQRIEAMRWIARLDFEAQGHAAGQVVVPTLVAWADDDALIEPAIFEALQAALPDGPRLRFEAGGHNIQKSHAATLAETLVAWCATLSPRAGSAHSTTDS